MIHLTGQDLAAHPVLEMLLCGEDPALAAWIVRDTNNPDNPQPFVTEPELSRIYSAYGREYIEWNGTVYQYTGWIT